MVKATEFWDWLIETQQAESVVDLEDFLTSMGNLVAMNAGNPTAIEEIYKKTRQRLNTVVARFSTFPGGLEANRPRKVRRKIYYIPRRILIRAFTGSPDTFPITLEEAFARAERDIWSVVGIYNYSLKKNISYRDDILLGEKSQIRRHLANGFQVLFDYHQEVRKGDLGDTLKFSADVEATYKNVRFSQTVLEAGKCRGELIRQAIEIWGIKVPKEPVMAV